MLTAFTRCTVLIAVLSLAVSSPAQEVASAPVTLWRFMGIPQGVQKVRDVMSNRRGNYPGMERKDALKRIADPANLVSDNPAIKAAAEIKAAEDMKQQKIKAIKYLAEIGCGCYDRDGKITEALLAATDDCTPDVRMAAVEAIQDAAGGNCCKKCGSTSCCSEEITMRLSEMAYERDGEGCPVEPSAEIRATAKRALQICCPGRIDPYMITEELENDMSVPTPPVIPVPGETGDEVAPIRGETGDIDDVDSSTEVLKTPTADEDDQTAIPALPPENLTTESDVVKQTDLVSFRLPEVIARSDEASQTGLVMLPLEDLTKRTRSEDPQWSETPPLEEVIVEPVSSQR